MLHILIDAANKGEFETVKSLVLAGNSIHETNNYGTTALLAAAMQGHLKVIQFLLDNDADINTSNKAGMTALALASTQGHVPTIKLLLQRGALLITPNKNARSPLFAAVCLGHLPAVKVLIQAGAKLDERGIENQTPLIAAAGARQLEVFKWLLNQGASLNDKNDAGENAYAFASKYQRQEIVTAIVEHLANQKNSSWSIQHGESIIRYGKDLLSYLVALFYQYTIVKVIVLYKRYFFRVHSPIVSSSQPLLDGGSKLVDVKNDEFPYLQINEYNLNEQIAADRSIYEIETSFHEQECRMQRIEEQLSQLKLNEVPKCIVTLEGSLQQQIQKNFSLEMSLSKQSQQIAKLNKHIEQLQKEIESTQQQFQQNSSFKKELESQKLKNHSLKTDLTKQSQLLKELQQQLKILQDGAQLNNVVEELELYKNTVKQGSLYTRQLENTLKEQTQKMLFLESAFSTQTKQITRLNKHIEQLQQEMENFQQNALLKKEIDLQRCQHLSLEAALFKQSGDMVMLQQQTNQLEEELKEQKQKILYLERSIYTAFQYSANLNKYIQKLQQQIETLYLTSTDLSSSSFVIQSQSLPLPFEKSYFDESTSAEIQAHSTQLNLIQCIVEKEIAHQSTLIHVKLPIKISNILDSFIEAGYYVLMVGGAVRDLLIGKTAADIDIITNMSPNELLDHFKQNFIKAVPYVSDLYQMVYSEVIVDVMCCETDIFTSSEAFLKDAANRAFTVNALYCDVQGKVYDPLKTGFNDLLHSPILRIIGDDLSWFKRDPSLLLRAVRLIVQYQLKIASSLKQAMQCFAPLVKKLDPQRLHIEHKRHFLRGNAVKNFECLVDLGLFAVFYPRTALFLRNSYGNCYQKWLYQKLHQTDELVINKRPASITYIYAVFLSGSVLVELEQCSEKTSSQINHITNKIVNESFQENFTYDYLDKIKKMTAQCVQKYLFLAENNPLSIGKDRGIKEQYNQTQALIQPASPLLSQFQTLSSSKKLQSLPRAHSYPDLSKNCLLIH